MRLKVFLLAAAFFASAASLSAEYIVLRSGQRLEVTGYERIGGNYRLQLAGGVAEVPVADVVAIQPQDVFPPFPPQPRAEKGPFRDLIDAAAQHHALDADLIISVIAVESNFQPRAVSRRNARGLMQLLPETARRLGVRDVFDPRENIEAGTRYLKELLARYNDDLVLALAAYNAGPARVLAYGNVPPYRETRTYVKRVKRAYQRRKTERPENTPATPGDTAVKARARPSL